jgi:hypothetical protein
MLVVIAIIVLITSIAAMSFTNMRRSSALGASANGVRAQVIGARAYAATHSVRTRVLFDRTGTLERTGRARIQWYDEAADEWRSASSPYPLRTGVEFFVTGDSPVQALDRDTDGLIDLTLEIDADSDIAIGFTPTGAIDPTDGPLGTANRQIGLRMTAGEGGLRAVIVLGASGLPYIEEAKP